MIHRLNQWINHSSANAVTYGIFLMLAAFFFFSISNVFVKQIDSSFSITQIIFGRGFVFCLLSPFFITRGSHKIKLASLLNPPSKGALLLRGALVGFSLWGIYYGLQKTPLANATVLCFAEIFFMSLLAIPMLKETVSKKQWVAMILGFIGVVIAVKPSSDLFTLAHLGPLAILAGALLDAAVMIYPRKLVKRITPNVLMVYYSFLSIPFIAILLYFDWTAPVISPTTMGYLCCLGISSFIGQFAATHAFRYAPTGILAPMIFSALLWAVFFGFIFWGEIPDAYTIIGGTLIIAAGAYVIKNERRVATAVVESETVTGNI